jgi:hypothetical protein
MKHQAINLFEMMRRETDPGICQGAGTSDFKFTSSRLGVFTDDVGTGKSDVILRLVKDQPSLERVDSTYRISECTDLFQKITLTKYERTLKGDISWLVVPHGLMTQWVELIKLYKIPVIVIRNKKEVADIKTKMATKLWLVSSTRYRELYNSWIREPGPVLARVIIDECDSIDVPSFPRIEAVFYWFVTSSIQNIYNPVCRRVWGANGGVMSTGIRSNGFIKHSLTNITPYMNQVIVKCNHEFVQECLNLPNPRMRFLNIKQGLVATALAGLVPTTVMSMVNANDFGAIAGHYSIHVVNSPLALVKKVIESLEETLDDTIHQETQTLATRKKADGLRNRISVIKDRIKNQDECNVCMAPMDPEDDDDEPIQYPTLTQCCHSIYCMECIIRSLDIKGLCPKCKEPINPKDLVSVGESVRTVEEIKDQSEYDTKPDALKYIFDSFKESNEVHRVLLFSEFEGGFTPIMDICESMDIKAKPLKGTGATIAKRIKEWETSKKTTILLLNAKSFGAGLNLQQGTDIILWHKLAAKVKGDSDLENQVLGRVVRYGLDHEPVVWKLAYPSEY